MALTTITVWGATYVVTKGVMSELTAIDVLVTRFTIGFLILAAVAKATGQSMMIQERPEAFHRVRRDGCRRLLHA